MHYRTVVPLALAALLLAPPALAQDLDSQFLARADSVVTARIDALERRWEIRFDPTRRPGIRLGLPYDLRIPNRSYLDGFYRTDSVLIYLTRPASLELSAAWPDTELVDHELVHAYCDQQSRRIGHGPWPDMQSTIVPSLGQAAANRMQMEGLAQAASSREALPWNLYWKYGLPKEPNLCFQPGQIGFIFTYLGGRTLVQPLIEQVGLERTVTYVILHPIDVRGSDFRRSLVRWVEKAFRDLNLPPPTRR